MAYCCNHKHSSRQWQRNADLHIYRQGLFALVAVDHYDLVVSPLLNVNT